MKLSKISRRTFFGTSIGASIAAGSTMLGPTAPGRAEANSRPLERASSDYEQFIRHWAAVGWPNDWSLVRDGLHPFSPERVVVLPDDTQGRLGCHSLKEARVAVIEKHRQINENWRRMRGFSGRDAGENKAFVGLCETDKGTACIQIMKIISDYYRAPEVFIDWTVGLLASEALMTTGLGRRAGLVHQYQRRIPARPKNPPVDWWLFLIPNGMDFQSLDGQAVHLLGGITVSKPNSAFECNALATMERVLWECHNSDQGNGSNLITVSRMDRPTACRRLNSRIPSVIAGLRM